MSKAATKIDEHVGSRVRIRRMMLEISQERLADQIGITFQQVQKYEKGINRIGASRLFQIAEALKVPVSFFFDGLESDDTTNGSLVSHMFEGQAGIPRPNSDHDVIDFVSTQEGLQLNSAFSRISCQETRRRIVDLVKTLARYGRNGDGGATAG